jgi:Na+-driven multidrug efflux pump
VLRGTGDVRYSAFIAATTSWLTLPPLSWWLGVHLGLGALGGWLALFVEITAGAGLLWWRLERGHWLRFAEQSRARLAEAEMAGVKPAPVSVA